MTNLDYYYERVQRVFWLLNALLIHVYGVISCKTVLVTTVVCSFVSKLGLNYVIRRGQLVT